MKKKNLLNFGDTYIMLFDENGREHSYEGYERQHVRLEFRGMSFCNIDRVYFPENKNEYFVSQFGICDKNGHIFKTGGILNSLRWCEGHTSPTFVTGEIELNIL